MKEVLAITGCSKRFLVPENPLQFLNGQKRTVSESAMTIVFTVRFGFTRAMMSTAISHLSAV